MATGPDRSIRTDGWLRSLIINILNTRARTDLKCPSPSAVYGHWSESYRVDGLYIGSRLWNTASKSYIRVADAVSAIEAAITADVNKLVILGVVDSVQVEAHYRGNNSVGVNVTAVTVRSQHVLNLSGNLLAGEWVWQ